MQTPPSSSATPPSTPLTLPRLLALLAVTVAATAAVVYFATRPSESADESVVSVMDARELASLHLNTFETIDAIGRSDLQPEIGRRYKVRIEAESRDGASCITRIGRMITFVDGVKPGDEVVVQVTRLKKNTAEAAVVEKEESGGSLLVPSATAAETALPSTSVSAPAETPTYTGTVVFVGKFGDGLVKLDGHNVFVPGTVTGDRIVYEVVERGERSWTGRLVSKLRAAEAEKGESGEKSDAGGSDVTRAENVQPGATYDVTITDKDRDNPGVDGMVRVDGLVVLVPGTQPGDHVKIRITDRRTRLAHAEVLSREPKADAAP